MIERVYSLVHPYPRYGLAAALFQARKKPEEVTEEELPEILAQAIEAGLGNFRMRTQDSPTTSEVLRYTPIKIDELRDEPWLIQSSGLAAKGIYLFPSIASTDGKAKETFDNAVKIAGDLRSGKKLDSIFVLGRSFAPTTAKINNGTKSQTAPKGTLFEAACSVVTTVTPLKPAAWVNKLNTVIIPDLRDELPGMEQDQARPVPLQHLYDFVEMFERMMSFDLKNLMVMKHTAKPLSIGNPQSSNGLPGKVGSETKSEYKRPLLHSGNYPFAPREAAVFGAIGLLGAIGQWAVSAGETPWADRVLETIKDQPLYLINYDAIDQVQFGHHVVNLARNGELSQIVTALTSRTLVGASEIESGRQNREAPARKLFYLMTSRFLQSFSSSSFQDFLAIHTQYPAEVKPLFEEYFMQTHEVTDELQTIVRAAEAYGQWLNLAAYLTAKAVVEAKSDKSQKGFWEKVTKEKAKIITVLESAVMSAKSGQAMIAQVSTQTGRLVQSDAPDKVRPFIYAVVSGQIDFNDARQLLMAYLRIQSVSERKAKPSISADPNSLQETADDLQSEGEDHGN